MAKEKTHDEQVGILFGYLAELREMEKHKYVNEAKIGYMMEDVESGKLEKALNHYPEVKKEFFITAKNLLLKKTAAGHF